MSEKAFVTNKRVVKLMGWVSGKKEMESGGVKVKE